MVVHRRVTMENDLNTLHEATLTLLERTGVKVDSRQALECLSRIGVRIDPTTLRVYPEARHIEAALALTPRSLTVYGRRPDRGRPVLLGGDQVSIMSGGGSLRVLTTDGQYEPSSWEHLRQFNILLDCLPNIHMLINQVDPVDQAGPGFYRRLAAEMLAGCTKPLCFQAATASDVRSMIEMGEAIRGSQSALVEQPLFMIGLNAEPPLHISGEVSDALLATCEAGLPVSMGNYAMMGITAPVTVAGALVQLNAVQMVAITLAQATREGTPICYTSFSGSADLRTLEVNTSTPHALQLLRLGIAMGRHYGLPVYSTALTDSRQPDPQAACERAVQLQLCIEAGADLIQGPTSHMDRMMLSSFVQAVIDNDIVGYVLAACRRPVVSAETLALEAGHDVTVDTQYADLKFVSHEHTVRHMRDEIWVPWAFDRDDFSAWDKAGRESVVERAAAKAREILAAHRPDPLPPAIADALRNASH
jgi:trimethylamine--corrinoid protein Co-methyltransferase